MFLLDSNVYIAGFIEPVLGEGCRAFHHANLPRSALSAVVVHELLVGARDRHRERALQRALIEPFRTRRRIHVPGARTWEMAADFDRGIRVLGEFAASLARRAFAFDILIAASPREIGAPIITSNMADLALIHRQRAIRPTPPWPVAHT